MADKMSMELAMAMELHPDFPVIYFCYSDGIWDDQPAYMVEIEKVIVDKVTNDIDDTHIYLRDYDEDELREGPWSDYCDEDEAKWEDDAEFEKWLDQYDWQDAIVVMMGVV